MRQRFFIPFLVVVFHFVASLFAQTPSGPDRPRSTRRDRQIVKRFAGDDGILDARERQAARKYAKANASPTRRGPRGGAQQTKRKQAGRTVRPDDVTSYPYNRLYDESILRTLFFQFENSDWEAEMADFYRTDVLVPATLTVDGTSYPNVGVGFRGNSSFFTLQPGDKRSLSVTMDAVDPAQRLYGYKTLNLLNGHADATFLRELLFSHVARNYLPAQKVNLVHVVINGSSWGIFVNAQQYNKDLIDDWFGNQGGIRWKIPAGRSGGGALTYNGDSAENYERFTLKTADAPHAWENLIELCKRLAETPAETIDTELDDILNIDRALWFIALDNVFIDGDGYISRGSDYTLYQDVDRRFHMIPYDSNETFRFVSGSGPNPAIPGAVGAELNPLALSDSAERPVISKLLANPRLKARYLAHVRTIVDQWLTWDKLVPIIQQSQDLIGQEVDLDTRKLYSLKGFLGVDGGGARNAPTLQEFSLAREAYLKSLPELSRPFPSITDLATHPESKPVHTKQSVPVSVKVRSEVGLSAVILYYAAGRESRFQQIPMHDDGKHHDGAPDDHVFGAILPPFPAGTHVRYYVEARSGEETGTTAFLPRNTEIGAFEYSVEARRAISTSVVINELLPSNLRGITDPQDELEDWIELHNVGTEVADLSGMFLSDKKTEPRKWQFPGGTIIPPGGYLLIWADEDVTAQGLHANFKLSKNGEVLLLVDSDQRGNAILDVVSYGKIRDDVSFARVPETDKHAICTPTPGAKNKGF